MVSETVNYSSPRHLTQLYCSEESNLARVEKALRVKIVSRDNWIQFEGPQDNVNQAKAFFDLMDAGRSQGIKFRRSDFIKVLAGFENGEGNQYREVFENPLIIKIRNKTIVPKTINQKRYLQFISKDDVVFGIGPAGTGKTYLAVAAALESLMAKETEKIIITRPAVEAGEALGFLPGDLQEKILPYLRPLHDAMYDMLGKEDTAKLVEKGLIEIAPLAYMRGRTLSNAYIILDEAQNTTPEQMMMFLTRLGENSKMVITGDITQVDLPRSKLSGLKQAVEVLNAVEGIKLFYFDHTDVVRHKLVSSIIKAYETHLSDRNFAARHDK